MDKYMLAVLAFSLLGSPLQADGCFDWSAIKNPVLQYPDWSIKDYGISYKDGVYYVFFSAFYDDNGRVRSHVVEVSTRDFKTFSEPIFNIDGEEDGWIGMCSPDVTRIGDTFYAVFNSWGDKDGKPNQLFYMTSKNLVDWSRRKHLAANLTSDIRAIDAALAYSNGKYILFYKEKQTTRCAMADSIDGPYVFIGDGLPKFSGDNGESFAWHENYQLLDIDDKWHLVAVTRDAKKTRHYPVVYEMDGDGTCELHWLKWKNGREMRVEKEWFNTHGLSNAACVLDARPQIGEFILFYAGTTEGDSYLGRGDNRLGIAKSKDLKTWISAGK